MDQQDQANPNPKASINYSINSTFYTIIIILLLIITALSFGIYYIYKKQFNTIQTPAVTVTDNTEDISSAMTQLYPTIKQVNSTEIPLYPEVDWKIIDLNPNTDRYLNTISVKQNGQDWGGDIVLNGKLYSATSKLFYGDFENYYTSQFEKNGWANEVKLNDLTIHGIAADGPSGSFFGCLKEKDGQIYVISYSWIMHNDRETEFSIFISEPVTISYLLQASENFQ